MFSFPALLIPVFLPYFGKPVPVGFRHLPEHEPHPQGFEYDAEGLLTGYDQYDYDSEQTDKINASYERTLKRSEGKPFFLTGNGLSSFHYPPQRTPYPGMNRNAEP